MAEVENIPLVGGPVELTNLAADQALPGSTTLTGMPPTNPPSTGLAGQTTPTNSQNKTNFQNNVDWVLQKFRWVLRPLWNINLVNCTALAEGLLGRDAKIASDPTWHGVLFGLAILWFALFSCLIYVGYTHENAPFDRSDGICANLLFFVAWLLLVAAGLVITLAMTLTAYFGLTLVSPLKVLEKLWPLEEVWIPFLVSAYFEFTYLCFYLVKKRDSYQLRDDIP